MIERTLVVILIVAALVAAWRLLGLWQHRRLRRLHSSPVTPELVPFLKPGRPTVIAFSTPGCSECRSRQLPALEQLQARLLDRVHIAHVSAPEHPALASHFGILTVPATIILDGTGKPHHINLRYTSADRLESQVLEIEAGSQGSGIGGRESGRMASGY